MLPDRQTDRQRDTQTHTEAIIHLPRVSAGFEPSHLGLAGPGAGGGPSRAQGTRGRCGTPISGSLRFLGDSAASGSSWA